MYAVATVAHATSSSCCCCTGSRPVNSKASWQCEAYLHVSFLEQVCVDKVLVDVPNVGLGPDQQHENTSAFTVCLYDAQSELGEVSSAIQQSETSQVVIARLSPAH